MKVDLWMGDSYRTINIILTVDYVNSSSTIRIFDMNVTMYKNGKMILFWGILKFESEFLYFIVGHI